MREELNLGGRPPFFEEAMLKTAFFLRKDQLEWLKEESKRRGIPRTVIVRDLIDAEIRRLESNPE